MFDEIITVAVLSIPFVGAWILYRVCAHLR